MSHIGHVERRRTDGSEPGTGPLSEGEAVVTVANGDEIYLTYAGRVRPDARQETFELCYLAVGGTGRFSRAEGEIVVSILYSSPAAFVGRGEGSIRCVAPNRSERRVRLG